MPPSFRQKARFPGRNSGKAGNYALYGFSLRYAPAFLAAILPKTTALHSAVPVI